MLFFIVLFHYEIYNLFSHIIKSKIKNCFTLYCKYPTSLFFFFFYKIVRIIYHIIMNICIHIIIIYD